MAQIRILLADDHAVVRQGFKMILGEQPDMEVVGEAGNGREALQLAAPTLVSFGEGIVVQHLRLAAGGSQLQAQGRLTPALELSVSLHQLSPQLLHPWLPSLDAEGALDADAQLYGSFTAPTGTVHLNAHGLHSRSGATRAT